MTKVEKICFSLLAIASGYALGGVICYYAQLVWGHL